jgi:hypothetical protein
MESYTCGGCDSCSRFVNHVCTHAHFLHCTAEHVEPESEEDEWQSAGDTDRMSVDQVINIADPTPACTFNYSPTCVSLMSLKQLHQHVFRAGPSHGVAQVAPPHGDRKGQLEQAVSVAHPCSTLFGPT